MSVAAFAAADIVVTLFFLTILINNKIMGRKKTSAQKNAEGTLRSDRNKQQKTGLLDEIPDPAFALNELALHIFERTCEALIAEEVMTALDVDTATQYAFWFDKFIEMQSKDYQIINDYSNGTNAIAGAATALLKFDDKVQKYSSLLGLSIKARDLMASFEKSESETESPIELALRSLNKGN